MSTFNPYHREQDDYKNDHINEENDMNTLTFTTKGSAMSKDKARILIQRTDLDQYGFPCGQPIDVCFTDSSIIITARSENEVQSKRKVSRVVDKRRGVTYQVFDLRFDNSQREEMFKGAERLAVEIENGTAIIKAA